MVIIVEIPQRFVNFVKFIERINEATEQPHKFLMLAELITIKIL